MNTELKNKVLQAAAKRNMLLDEAKEVSARRELSDSHLILSEKSIKIFQIMISTKKKETTDKIEKLVSAGLQTIFEDSSYQFKIEDRELRSQIVYSFKLYNGTNPTGQDIIDSHGGGVANIVSFLLNIIILLLVDRGARRFLVLDEVFNNLSKCYHDNLVTFIKSLVKQLGFQLLLITHQESLFDMADAIYTVKKTGQGFSTIERKV